MVESSVDPKPEPVLVVGGLLVEAGSVLLCHRRPDRAWYPDLWDVPGGHLEEAETPADALARELGEELGVIAEPMAMSTAAVLHGEGLVLHLLEVGRWTGVPHNAAPEEHDEVGWFGIDDLGGLKLAHPSFLPILARALA